MKSNSQGKNVASSKEILLLTATISPPTGVRDLARSAVELRKDDYLRAFNQHLELLSQGTVDAIVFAENSCYDLSFLESLAQQRGLRDRVEFLSHSGLDFPPEYGRAYGELNLICYAMRASKFLSSSMVDDNFVWKVTGRYWVRNLEEMIRSRPAGVELYCNMRNYPCRWVDMFLMGWTRRGFDVYLSGAAESIRVGLPGMKLGVSPEMLLRDWLEGEGHGTATLGPRFTRVPVVDGIRGFDNASYLEAQRWKTRARRLALRIAPKLWI